MLISAGRDGLAETITLHRVHAGRAQKQVLLGSFDAFGGDFHAEPATEAHDGMDDRGGVCGASIECTKL